MASRRNANAPPAGEDDGASPYHPSQASPQAVQLGITGAVAGVALLGVAMCVLAALVTLFVIWVVPPPGTTDAASQMSWTRGALFSAKHDYVNGLAATGMTVLQPSGVAYEDVHLGTGHLLSKGDFVILLLKMYLASPVPPSAAAAAATALAAGAEPVPAHTFLFSRADEKHAMYALLGAAAAGQDSELLPGVEAGLVGMRTGGRRKVVVPPALAYGASGLSHKTGMRTVEVPPNATLLFYVEVMRAGHFDATADHDEL